MSYMSVDQSKWGIDMKVGDLVRGQTFIYHNYGIGIVIGHHFGGLKVYWPQEETWSYISKRALQRL